MVPTWLKTLFPRRSSRRKPVLAARPAARPSLVQLEDRAVPAVISIANNAIVEGNAGTQTLMFTVSADTAEAADITFKINTADVSAKAGSDYVALSNVGGTITAGNKSTTVMVTINGDNTVELNESFTVTLSNLSAGNTFSGGGATESATGTINNNDSATVTIADDTQAEGTDITFTATLTNPVDTDITIDLTPSKGVGDNATETTDFSTATQTITILAGQLTGSTTVSTVVDTTVELDETFTATLGNLAASGRSVTGNGNKATGTIANDDTTKLSIADSSASEGTAVTFTASLTNPVDVNVTITLTPNTIGLDSATKTTDYSGTAKTITILAGSLTGTASVVTVTDTVVESNETFTATLSGVTASGREADITTTDGVAVGTITNDDITVLTIADKTVAENGASTTFTIVSSLAVQGSFTVDYKTNSGTAIGGTDYVTKTGTASFNGTAGESKTFTVTITNDNIVEADETFTVSLLNVVPTGGVSTGAFNITDTATGTITNDDSAQFKISATASGTEGNTVDFTVTLTNPASVATSVTVTTTDGTAKSPQDFAALVGTVVSFPAGTTSKTVSVTTKDNNQVDGTRKFTIDLGGLNDGGLTGDITIDAANDTGTGSILDNDTATFSIANASVTEGGTVMFTVTLSSAVAVDTSVKVTTSDLTADSADYTGVTDFLVSFPAGTTSVPVMIATKADAIVEADETFKITLGSLNNGGNTDVTISGTNGSATGTITNDDTTALTILDKSVSENGGTVTFTVSLSNAVQGGFSVDYKTVDVSAVAGSDYVSKTGTLTFAGTAGESKTFDVTISNDNVVEADETFTIQLLNLAPPAGVLKANIDISDTATGTITNDDSAKFSITKSASATEGSKVSFTVTLTNPVDVATSVTVTTADITAVAGDYTALAGTVVNFPALSTSQIVMVSTTGDNIVEPDETFSITLGGLVNGGRPTVTIDATADTGTGTITNDDSAVFSIANASATEGGTITFTITLSNPVSTATSVTVTTADIASALDGTDYTGLVGVVVPFAALTTSGTAKVNTTPDAIVEADETFKATLGGLNDGGFPGKVTISGVNGSATGTITNDDSTALTITDVTQAEAAGTMKFTITLGAAVQGGFSVDFKTINGTATTGDADYVAASGTLNFAGNVGETQSFTVTVNDDNKVELDQTFTVSLSNVVPAAGVSAAKIDATDTGTGTIVNDDAAQFSINATSAVIEGGMVTFTISLTNPVDAPTSVTVTTTDGKAKSAVAPAFDNDFVAKAASVVNFGTTVTSVNVSVATNADNIVELDEIFTIALGGLNNAGRAVTIDAANDTGTGTITNDDSAQVKISKVASAIEGGPITFTVTLTNPIDVATSVEVTTADLTATAGVDYTALVGQLVSFPALSTSQNVAVATTPDLVVEANETFTATLGNLVDGGRPTLTISATDNVGTGTITNDDKATLLTIANVAQDEDTGDLVFTVQLTADVQGGFNVDISSKDGTATVAGNDYKLSTATLAFNGTAGETKMFSVPANPDNMVEANETFTVHLSNLVPNDAKVSPGDIDISSVGTGTITNDDSTTLTVADVSQAEGAGKMTFTVTLSNPVQGGLKVDFKTFDGTALISDNDYVTSMGTLTFAGTAGETKMFTVTVNEDSTIEPDEFFTAKLSNVVTLGAGVSAAKVDATDTAAGNILTDDKAVIDLFASTDVEGNNLVYTITLSNKISKDVSVDFATLAGVGARPATSGADFTAVAKTVTFTAGTTKLTVLVPLTDDRRVEGSEQFDAKISNIAADASVLTALSFGKAQDTATITDNDTAVFAFTAAKGGALENNVAGVTATVQLSVVATGTGPDGLDQPITIRVSNAGGTATNGVDYLNFTNPSDLTFAPGNFTTTAQNIAFDLVEDLTKEGDETIVFNIAVQADATAGKAAIGATSVHTFAIQSDDETVRTYDATVAGDYRFVNDGAGNVQLFVGPTLLATDAIGTQAILMNGTANMAQPVEGVESATVDYVNGSPVPSGGITFNANGPAAGERFIVSGGAFASIQATLTATQNGTLTLAGTTNDTLTYQNVDAVEINASSVGTLTLLLPAGASDAILEDDGILGNGISQIRSANGTFATTKFVNPTGTLTVTPGNAADTLAISALPDNTSSLIAGSTGIRFASVAQNGPVGSNGDVRFFANAIAIADGADLAATGAVELNATATVTLGNAKIQGNTVTQSGGSTVNITVGDTATLTATGVAGTTILFSGTIDGPGSLTTSSAGESVFKAEIGKTTPLNSAIFGSPINADGTSVTGGALNIAANTIAFNGAVSAKNAPIVLTLTGGTATQSAPFTTTQLFLNGDGKFILNNANNQLTAVPLGTIASFITMQGATTNTDVAGIQALPGELFVNMNSGSIDVRDKTDLVIRFQDAGQSAPAIRIGSNGNATLTAGGDVSIEDPRTSNINNALNNLLNVGTGKVQVFVGVERNDPSQSTTVRYLAEAAAGSVTLGSPPTPTDNFDVRQKSTNFADPANLENVAKDTFTVRPMLGSPLTIHGNSPIVTDPLAFRPYDSLSPQFAGVGSTTLTPMGNGNGTFTFAAANKFQPLTFTSIETLGGIQAEAFVVQTGPSKLTTANNYAVRFQATISGTPITGSLSGNGIITNPFVVTPSVGGATQFDSPQITFADVDGDTTPDLIIANGSGDAPIITIIKGGRVFSNAQINISQLDPTTDIIAQFFAFEETFRGGVSVRAADFDGDGRAEVAVSPGIGGGPRIIVYKIDTTSGNVFNNAQIYRHKLANGTFTNPYNFFPYESSFRGGVNVAIGDVNGDGTPDIIAGAGFGGGPRVRVFDGAVDPTLADGVTQNPASTIADFFAYDPGFRGGVYVDAGRFDADAIADLVTAPGPGGSAHIQVFQGRKNAQPFIVDAARGAEFRVPAASFFAFEDQPSLFNPQPMRTGVGSVAFGASTDMLGGMRSILVTRPEGTVFEIVKFEPVDASTPLSGTVQPVAPLGLLLRRTTQFQNSFAGVLNPNDPNFLPSSVLLQDGGSAAGSS